jgi:DNA-binding CsgD family transcriptional regulator
MKKVNQEEKDELRPEYKLSDFPGGMTRGKYAERARRPLNAHEMEILKYIGRGYLNKQIAADLGISEQTVKTHVTSIVRKLNANARTEGVESNMVVLKPEVADVFPNEDAVNNALLSLIELAHKTTQPAKASSSRGKKLSSR